MTKNINLKSNCNITVLEKLFYSCDNTLIRQGIELLRSLDDIEIYSYFLKGVRFDISRSRLIPNEIFSLKKRKKDEKQKNYNKKQIYLDTILLNIIVHAPDNFPLAKQIKEEIKKFSISLSFLEPLTYLTNLEELSLTASTEILDLKELKNLKNLQSLKLDFCKSLESLNGIEDLTNIETINLSYCENLKDINAIKNLKKITALDFRYCESLQNINPLGNLINIKYLFLRDCYNIKKSNVLYNLVNIPDEFRRGMINDINK